MPDPVPLSGSQDTIGGYRILEVLGKGGMGEVFLAWDERLQRNIAVKRIRHDGSLNETLRLRLLREAQAVARLSHPAIVQIYDLKEDPSGDCIVMEYVPGQTLTEALTARPFEPGHAVRLAREIATGLAAAHAAGIVHRDLKTENVILTPSGHAKILDFGLAKPVMPAEGDASLTERGCVVGTCRSMSPEQARGREVDGRSDLFSLGVLLYEVLTGEHPFRGATNLESVAQVLKHRPPRVDVVRPGVPPQIALLIERLLAKDPADRPQSADEVARNLEAIEGRLPGPSSEETLSELPTGHFLTSPPSSHPVPRSLGALQSTAGMSIDSRSLRLRILALVSLGALILGAAGYYFFLRQHPVRSVPAAPHLLRVLVNKPEEKGANKRLHLASSKVMTTIFNTLRRNGLEPIDPSAVVEETASLKAKTKAVAAPEALVTTLESADESCVVTLRRVEGSSGKNLWSGDPFEVSLEPGNQRLLEEQVVRSLRVAYSISKPVPPMSEVNDRDYNTFLEIQGNLRLGSIPNILPKLKALADNSPQFLDAQLLAANMYFTQFASTRDTVYLDTAESLAQKAQDLMVPNEARPLFLLFKVSLARGKIDDAKAALKHLKSLKPADPQLLLLQSQLAEREGRKDEALTRLNELVRQLPTWDNLYYLADLDARTGRVTEARSHISKILSDSPENRWALEQSARIELLYGEPSSAETLYQKLIANGPHRAYYVNLGNARVLQGRYKEALDPFKQALNLDPGNVAATISLADAELALKRGYKAREDYRKALGSLNRNLSGATLTPHDYATRAQCLVHLDELSAAEADIQLALKGSPQDGDVLQAAALVYVVAGDRDLALDNIQKALDQGVNPHWFQLPAFASFNKDPDYRRLMTKKPGATP